ncbi:MAG: hypothetical protein A3G81_25125 [Betaproteobacteria bacterium RIFCSPLOWO2_12_FULL_65_14]|nr:MAG: hypothetical protein A3G81_25125 [Betaproteobacteria bacterium RIFCSPLOWO2_12_FULL_65_14]
MKRFLKARPRDIATCLLVLLAAFFATALAQKSLRQLPPLLRTLSDEVGVLSLEEGLTLSRSLEEIRDLTGVRVIMAIAGSTEPEAIDDRTMQVMPGRALASVERALGNPGVTSDLGPLLRKEQYFEALMTLTARLRAIVQERPASQPAARPAQHYQDVNGAVRPASGCDPQACTPAALIGIELDRKG